MMPAMTDAAAGRCPDCNSKPCTCPSDDIAQIRAKITTLRHYYDKHGGHLAEEFVDAETLLTHIDTLTADLEGRIRDRDNRIEHLTEFAKTGPYDEGQAVENNALRLQVKELREALETIRDNPSSYSIKSIAKQALGDTE
jgi:hypothetical protein